MTSAQTGTGAGSDSPEGRSTPCADCDPDLLDRLKCRAVGIQAQADYNKTHEDALTKARTQYDGARSAYSAARSTARPDVDDLRKQLAQVIDQLKCLVDNEYRIRLLDRAFSHVERRLRACDPNEGCAFDDDCDFDDSVRDCRPEDVASTIADIERRTAAAAMVFTDLIAEPVNLAKRVADLKTETTAIVTKMASDSRTVDFVMLYAAALVARDHLERIWRGFEHVNAYVDCLCRTLTCQIKGYAAVSDLKRQEAVDQCHQDQHAAACKKLEDHTADEVYAEYIRLRSEPHRDPEESGRRDDNHHDEYGGDRGNDREERNERDRDRERESGGHRHGHEERGRS
jgi:hypothetical protein